MPHILAGASLPMSILISCSQMAQRLLLLSAVGVNVLPIKCHKGHLIMLKRY